MADRPGALAAIGRTPVVRLTTLPGADAAEVWIKLEGANPTGSYKDRMALATKGSTIHPRTTTRFTSAMS